MKDRDKEKRRIMRVGVTKKKEQALADLRRRKEGGVKYSEPYDVNANTDMFIGIKPNEEKELSDFIEDDSIFNPNNKLAV